MDAVDVVQASGTTEATSDGVVLQNSAPNEDEAPQTEPIKKQEGDDPATAESLLGKVLKYENSIKLLSEQLSAQKQLCDDRDKSLQAFHVRLCQLKTGINSEINKLRSREQLLYCKEHELNRVMEVVLKYISDLKGAGGGGAIKDGTLVTTETALLELMSSLKGPSVPTKDTRCAALSDALNSLLEGDITHFGDVCNFSDSKTSLVSSHLPHSPPPPPMPHLSHPPPLPPKSSAVVPSKEVGPHGSPSLVTPSIPPKSKKAKPKQSSENAHSSSDSDFEHFVPPSSRNSTRENSLEPQDTSASSPNVWASSPLPRHPQKTDRHKQDKVKKSNSDPKSNKVASSLPRTSQKKVQSNRSMSLSALEKNNIVPAAVVGDSDDNPEGVADSTGYSKPFDHLSNWKQTMLADDVSGGKDRVGTLSLSMSLDNSHSKSETAVHTKGLCDSKGLEQSQVRNRHSITEALLHRKDSKRSAGSKENYTASDDHGMVLCRESSTADGYVTAAEIAVAVVGARRKPTTATTPMESTPGYLAIIPSTEAVHHTGVEVGGGPQVGCHRDRQEPNAEQQDSAEHGVARGLVRRRAADTMGRVESSGSGHQHRNQDSTPLRDSYLKMVKSDSSTSLLDSDAPSIGPMPLYTKRSSAKGVQLVSLVKRAKSERIAKSNVDSPKRRHSASIDVEYQIPPDAEEGYVEENRQKASIPLKFCSSITFSTPGKEIESCEKSGHLQKYDMKQRRVARRWFVLRDSELKYYRAKETFFGIGRPRGVIDLGDWCRLLRCARPTTFQLDTPQKTYHLVADSIKECEEWLKAIQIAMQSSKAFVAENDNQCTLSSWAVVTYGGSNRKLWCFLEGNTLRFARAPDAKTQREIDLDQVRIKFDQSHAEEDYTEIGDGGGGTISIMPTDSSDATIISVGSAEEMNSWMYNLTRSSGGPVLTLTEKLIVQVKSGEAPTNVLWAHPVMIYTSSPILQPLTTLPSSDLFAKVKNLFQSIQLFMGTPINSSALDYHIHAVQHILKTGTRYPALHNEIYCLVLKQMSEQDSVGLRGWILLFLLTSTFAPTGNVLWYLDTFLDHFASQPNPTMAELTKQCQSTLKRTQKNGPRECKPSKLELQHILSQNIAIPNSIQVKLKLPVHLTNGTSVELEFYMSTTVQELVSHLNQEIGMPDVSKTGFALMSDWPGVEDCSLFYLLPTSKLCDIISMWYDSLEELNPVRVRQQRMINLTYRNRLSLQVRSGLESEKEAVLLAYQVNSEVTSGRYLVAKNENIFRMAAYMCQIEYGEWKDTDDSHKNISTIVKDGLDKFYPKTHLRQTIQQDQGWLQNLLIGEWKSLLGYTRQQCAQKYLQAARGWQFSMSTLLQAEERIFCQTNPRNRAVWLAIQESGVSILDRTTMECLLSHSFKEITTFGSHGDDFMLVVSPQPGIYPVRPEQVTPEALKYFISMPKLQVREATLLMASYLEVHEQ